MVGGKINGLSGDTKPTNVPANTTFIETDTFLEFIFDGATWQAIQPDPSEPDFSENFTGDGSNWTTVGTLFAFNTAQDRMDSTAGNNTDRTTTDIGFDVSDTAWVMRTTWTITTLIQGASADANWVFYGLGNNVNASNVNQTSMLATQRIASNKNVWAFQFTDITETPSSLVNLALSSEIQAVNTRYLEQKRITATTARVEWFSDASYTTSTNFNNFTPTSADSINLRYVKFMSRPAENGNSTLIGNVTLIQLWNDVSTVPT